MIHSGSRDDARLTRRGAGHAESRKTTRVCGSRGPRRGAVCRYVPFSQRGTIWLDGANEACCRVDRIEHRGRLSSTREPCARRVSLPRSWLSGGAPIPNPGCSPTRVRRRGRTGIPCRPRRRMQEDDVKAHRLASRRRSALRPAEVRCPPSGRRAVRPSSALARSGHHDWGHHMRLRQAVAVRLPV